MKISFNAFNNSFCQVNNSQAKKSRQVCPSLSKDLFVKNSNINYFNADLVLNTSIYNTDILVNNRFKSTVIKSNQDDYRDANSLSILVNRKINSAIVLGFQNGLIYSSDTKTSSNNKLIDIASI